MIGAQGGTMLVSYGMGDNQADIWAVRNGTITGELVLTQMDGLISVSAGGNTVHVAGTSIGIVMPNANEGP
jgi:hypothetical protein